MCCRGLVLHAGGVKTTGKKGEEERSSDAKPLMRLRGEEPHKLHARRESLEKKDVARSEVGKGSVHVEQALQKKKKKQSRGIRFRTVGRGSAG